MNAEKIRQAAEDALKMLDILREDHGVGEILPPGTKELYESVSENLREALGHDDAFVKHLEHSSEVVRGWPEWRQGILGGTIGGDDGQSEGC